MVPTFFNPDFLLTEPLDVGSALNELLRGAERLNVMHAGDTVAVYVASVDVRARTFRFRPYGGDEAFAAIRGAGALAFEGAANGAQIDFTVNEVRLADDAGEDGAKPAFEAAFPIQVYRMQRREFFRAAVSPPPTRMATWRTPADGEVRFRIQDVSLAGVGLRSRLAPAALPQPRDVLSGVVLDFNEHGAIRANLRVVAAHTVKEHDVREGNLEYTHLGCEFAQPDARRDTYLQKLVYQLELAKRD